jgi:nicotinamidase-related amidase
LCCKKQSRRVAAKASVDSELLTIAAQYGAEQAGRLNLGFKTRDINEFITKVKVLLKGTSGKDDGYSAFEATNVDLEKYLKDKGVDELYVTGLTTEYCVLNSALDAKKKGFNTYVVEDAIEGVKVKEGDVEEALDKIRKTGIEIVTSEKL